MASTARTRGRRYLHHLTATDHDLLARVVGTSGAAAFDRPGEVERLLATEELFTAVFPEPGPEEPVGLADVSPFLAFSTAIHRAHAELDPSSVVAEWVGARERLPVFAGGELRDFLDDGDHRLFLAELLASYTHVTVGAVTWQHAGRLHRRRVSALDLTGMARLLDVVTDEDRPGLYRRLGDLSLFLTGVFPDHTARRRFAPIQLDRLARSLHATSVGTDELTEAMAVHGGVGLLEHLGQRWYRLAIETATGPADRLSDVASVSDRFPAARRVLNLLTDRWLFPFRANWSPTAN